MTGELEELLTGADVARLIGVSRQRVSQLADQPTFPAPLGRVGNYVVWRRTDIETWARAAGRALTQ